MLASFRGASAESKLATLRDVKAFVQVLSKRPGQDTFRGRAVVVVEAHQRVRSDRDGPTRTQVSNDPLDDCRRARTSCCSPS